MLRQMRPFIPRTRTKYVQVEDAGRMGTRLAKVEGLVQDFLGGSSSLPGRTNRKSWKFWTSWRRSRRESYAYLMGGVTRAQG